MQSIYQFPQSLSPITLWQKQELLRNQIRTVPRPAGTVCTEGSLSGLGKDIGERISFCEPKTAKLGRHPLSRRLQGVSCWNLGLQGALPNWIPFKQGRKSQQECVSTQQKVQRRISRARADCWLVLSSHGWVVSAQLLEQLLNHKFILIATSKLKFCY